MSTINNLPGGVATYVPQGGSGGVQQADAMAPAQGARVTELDNPGQYIATGGTSDSTALAAPGSSGSDIGSAAGAAKALAGLSGTVVETDMYAVMSLFQKMAQEQRNSARELRSTEQQAQTKALMGAADEIRSAAQERFVGAVTAGAMQIAGGVVQAGMAGASFKYGAKGASEELAGRQASGLATKAGAFTGSGQGLSGVMSGVGSIVNATQEKKAAEHDAKKAELEASAKVHETSSQQAGDKMQQMADIIRDVHDKLGAMEQSRVETNRGMARNI